MTAPRLRRSAHLALKRVAAAKAKVGLQAPIRDSVEEWAAAQQDAQSRLLFPVQRIERTLPCTVEPELHAGYLDRRSAVLHARYLVPVHGAKLVGRNGMVRLPDGSFAAESVYGRAQVEQDPAYYAPRRRPVVAQQGNYFSLVVNWAVQAEGNYYHWLHDTLQRLHGVMPILPTDTRFIVPANLQPFQRETLQLIGLKEDQLAPFSGDEDWELETLHFAPASTNSGSDRREVDEWFRDTILDALGITPTATGRRIYVSRRSAPSRRLVNEDAVENYLQRYGFETCIAETLSMREQVKLFSQADIVVASHGAGLMNIMYSPRGLIVVEMVPPDKTLSAYIYWTMAEQLGHPYWYFDLDSAPRDGYDDDAHVSLDKLAATFDQLHIEPKG
jgi:hypothetical protein